MSYSNPTVICIVKMKLNYPVHIFIQENDFRITYILTIIYEELSHSLFYCFDIYCSCFPYLYLKMRDLSDQKTF